MASENFTLPSKIHDIIFNRLSHIVFNNCHPLSSLTAIIVGAQLDSGKSALILISKKLYIDNCAIINGDDYRTEHPFLE
jgi:hypothetical protein